MSDTICGHDRERLIFVLRRADTCPGECDWKMIKLVYDSAKLAAIIAELMRGHGLDWTSFWDDVNEDIVVRKSNHDLVQSNEWVDWPARRLTMPQARAFTLTLLNAPIATAQDIERIIGEL